MAKRLLNTKFQDRSEWESVGKQPTPEETTLGSELQQNCSRTVFQVIRLQMEMKHTHTQTAFSVKCSSTLK